jgi:hypothetical protein
LLDLVRHYNELRRTLKAAIGFVQLAETTSFLGLLGKQPVVVAAALEA